MLQRVSEPLRVVERQLGLDPMPSAAALLARCESPIEREFALALLAFIAMRRQWLNWQSGYTVTVDFAVEPQHRVTTPEGNYRIDFLVSLQANGVTYRLGVECDGHAFHERTKLQAAEDKRRDRDLLAAGYQVMRFTGSEVHQGPGNCAAEVVMMLEAAAGLDGGRQ